MPKILVKSAADGYRRAGIAFTREGVEIDTSKLKKAQLEAIEQDPRLRKSEIVEAKPQKPETAAEKKAREKAEADAAKKAADDAADAAKGGGDGNSQDAQG